jgi:CcmD family protein
MTHIAVLLLLALLAGAPVVAQERAKPPAGSQDGFVSVDAPLDPGDPVPAPLLVGSAYAFIWIVLFGYLWSLRTRLATVEREMTTIEQRMASRRK